MFLANILIALAWTAIMGEVTLPVMSTGFALGYVVLYFTRPSLGESTYFSKVDRRFRFNIYFVRELVKSNFRVAYRVIRNPKSVRPAIIAIPLEVESDFEITCLANLITLTPGTLSIDLSEDRKTLYVHALFADDIDVIRAEITEQLQRRLLEALR